MKRDCHPWLLQVSNSIDTRQAHLFEPRSRNFSATDYILEEGWRWPDFDRIPNILIDWAQSHAGVPPAGSKKLGYTPKQATPCFCPFSLHCVSLFKMSLLHHRKVCALSNTYHACKVRHMSLCHCTPDSLPAIPNQLTLPIVSSFAKLCVHQIRVDLFPFLGLSVPPEVCKKNQNYPTTS